MTWKSIFYHLSFVTFRSGGSYRARFGSLWLRPMVHVWRQPNGVDSFCLFPAKRTLSFTSTKSHTHNFRTWSPRKRTVGFSSVKSHQSFSNMVSPQKYAGILVSQITSKFFELGLPARGRWDSRQLNNIKVFRTWSPRKRTIGFTSVKSYQSFSNMVSP